MKYLLIAIMLSNGETSGLMPTSWFDSEAACIERGEELDRWAREEQKPSGTLHYDCLGLSKIDILTLGKMVPYSSFAPR